MQSALPQISCDEQRLRFANFCGAEHTAAANIRSLPCRYVLWIMLTDMQRIRHLLQRKFVRKMLVDVTLDALCKGIAALCVLPRLRSAELLHERQDRKQKMMCTVVVALGQLIVKHVVQMPSRRSAARPGGTPDMNPPRSAYSRSPAQPVRQAPDSRLPPDDPVRTAHRARRGC